MCYYIVLVVQGSDASTIDRVLRRHGRRAKPINNASIARALVRGEAQFLTAGNCDCGTALARYDVHDHAGNRAEQAAKLARKGWSQAKIDRWLQDRVKADARAEQRLSARPPDSYEIWSRIVSDLLSTPGVLQAGLLLHFYSGDIEEESVEPVSERVPARDFADRLQQLREDQLLVAAA